MLKGFVSGEEKDIVRIPMKGKNLWDLQSWTNTTNDTRSFFQLSITLYNGSTSFGECRFNVHETGRVSLTSATAGADGATRLGIKHNGSTRDLAIGSVYDDFPANQPLTISFDVSGYDPTIAGGISISNIMLNLGSTALPYEPYGYQEGWEVRDNQDRLIWGREDEFQTATGTLPFKGYALPVKVKSLLGNGSQTGTPTPDNPVMPTFCGVRTAQLFDYQSGTPTAYKYLDENGTEIAVSELSPWYITDYIPIPDGTLSVTLSKIGGGLPAMCAYDASKNYITGIKYDTGSAVTKVDVTLTSSSPIRYIRFSYFIGNIGYDDISTKMLNSGSTALPYEPFGYKIHLTCAGQTVPVYLGQTQTVRRVKKLVLTGEEEWVYRSREPQNVYFLEFAGLVIVSNYGLCTHYPNQNSGGFSELADKHVLNRLSTDRSRSYIAIRDSSFSLLSDFKAYLAAQYAAGTPVTIWYVLATPETAIVNEPLCKIGNYADELSSTVATLPEIPTTTGENTLTVETEKIHGLTNPLCGIGDYKDVLNLSTGVITRKVKKLVLTGTEVWNRGSYPPSGGYQFFTPKPSDIIDNPSSWIMTHFRAGSGLNGSAFASYLSLYPERSILPENATANDFKAWLAAQYANGTPVCLWYILSTPETETITVPYGLECSIEGYLTQSSTPAPSSPITPDSNGILESGGTYAVEVSLVPSNLTVKGHIKELT